MLKPTLSIVTIFLMINLNYGQTFNDTIVTSSTDTIFCKITLVNEFNLFYDYNPKRKIIKTAHIERETVLFFSVSDTSVYIMEKQTPPTPIERERYSYKEENGIIYHNTYSTPPIYGNGLPNLNDFITKNVRVYPSDTREFRGQIVTVLFSVAISAPTTKVIIPGYLRKPWRGHALPPL